MSSATQLSKHDRVILGALFDPEASLDRSTNIQDITPSDITASEAARNAEQTAIRLLNTSSPSQHDVESAVEQLTNIITSNPNYASAYNNRAQACRLLPDAVTNASTLGAILSDLNRAISLSTPALPVTPITAHDARVLASAHAHRGYLFLRASTSEEFFNLVKSVDVPSLVNVTAQSACEELASRDFSIAGRYGNKTAQSLAVKTNPYAKLCGQIVKEALQREITTYYTGESMGVAS